jgi:multidrug efflux pump subunit AcrB
MASTWLKLDTKMSRLPGDVLLRWLIQRYDATLRWALSHRKITLSLTFSAYIIMFIIYGVFNHGIEFFPDLEPTQATVRVETALGSRLETSDKIVRDIEKRLSDVIDMEYYVAQVGNAGEEMDFSSGGSAPHKSKVTIDFVERYQRQQNSFKTLDQIREKVQTIPGAEINVSKPQEGPPTGKAVEIQIKGEDFRVLDEISTAVQREIRDISRD